jgi:hypothetical protein
VLLVASLTVVGAAAAFTGVVFTGVGATVNTDGKLVFQGNDVSDVVYKNRSVDISFTANGVNYVIHAVGRQFGDETGIGTRFADYFGFHGDASLIDGTGATVFSGGTLVAGGHYPTVWYGEVNFDGTCPQLPKRSFIRVEIRGDGSGGTVEAVSVYPEKE